MSSVSDILVEAGDPLVEVLAGVAESLVCRPQVAMGRPLHLVRSEVELSELSPLLVF